MTVTETHLKGKEKINIRGYKWTGSNREKTTGGGVGILIRNDIAPKITEELDVEQNISLESQWIKLDTKPKPLYIGCFYGPQENKNLEQVKETYSSLGIQIRQLQSRGEVILMGDFNAKIEINNEKAQQTQSRNGKLLQKLMDEHDLTALNKNPEDGIWTRVNRNKIEEKSIIDYILASQDIRKYMGATLVDEIGNLRIGGKNQTDHNTITTDIRINNKQKPIMLKGSN